jgi:hypothetical protein
MTDSYKKINKSTQGTSKIIENDDDLENLFGIKKSPGEVSEIDGLINHTNSALGSNLSDRNTFRS